MNGLLSTHNDESKIRREPRDLASDSIVWRKIDPFIKEKLDKNESLREEYYRVKSFREVNMHIDAPCERHIKMIGSKHNRVKDAHFENQNHSSSDEEDVNDDNFLDR